VWRLYLHVLAPTLVVVLLICALAVFSVRALGAVRGYVGGESIWSKARADAVQHLRDYAQSQDPDDYSQFEEALAIPMADRAAREELERPDPQRDLIRANLLRGGIHPDDIDDMSILFIWFGESFLFEDAMDIWRRADAQLARLQTQAQRLHLLGDAHASPQTLHSVLAEIDQINETLRGLELGFSSSLNSAARMTERLLLLAIVSFALLLLVLSVTMIRKPLRQQSIQQRDLLRANRRWELAVAGSGLGLFELDYATGEVHLDARTAEICGMGAAPRTLTREEMFRLIAPEDADVSAEAIENALRTGELFQARTRVVMPDGEVRHILSTGRLAEDPYSGE